MKHLVLLCSTGYCCLYIRRVSRLSHLGLEAGAMRNEDEINLLACVSQGRGHATCLLYTVHDEMSPFATCEKGDPRPSRQRGNKKSNF